MFLFGSSMLSWYTTGACCAEDRTSFLLDAFAAVTLRPTRGGRQQITPNRLPLPYRCSDLLDQLELQRTAPRWLERSTDG